MSAKFQRYNMLLDTIYAAAGDPSCWPEAISSASEYIGAIGGMLAHIAPPGGGHHWMILGGLSEEFQAVSRQYLPDPWALAMKSVPCDLPMAGSSLVEKNIVRRSGLYADVMKPHGIEEMLGVNLKEMTTRGGMGGFSFSLTARGVERTAESLKRFRRLLPHLKRAFEASLHMGSYADGTRQLARVLELMPSPALLLDAFGRITYANAGAEALLRLNDGLSAARDGSLHLTAALPAETAALQLALGEVLLVANGDDSALQGPLRLTRPSGRAPLLVLPVPLPPSAFAMWELVESARAMVLIIDPEAQSLDLVGTVQTAYGLTVAEARVAAMIGGGLSGPQTAAALGISPETVKTHLTRCFSKTGTHSQAGLVRLIGMLPRPAR